MSCCTRNPMCVGTTLRRDYVFRGIANLRQRHMVNASSPGSAHCMQSVTINGGLEKLTRRLAQFRPLPTEERLALAATLSLERAFDPREEMMQERRAVDGAHLIVEGFACRCKLLADGRRQILGILLPGDLCG